MKKEELSNVLHAVRYMMKRFYDANPRIVFITWGKYEYQILYGDRKYNEQLFAKHENADQEEDLDKLSLSEIHDYVLKRFYKMETKAFWIKVFGFKARVVYGMNPKKKKSSFDIARTNFRKNWDIIERRRKEEEEYDRMVYADV